MPEMITGRVSTENYQPLQTLPTEGKSNMAMPVISSISVIPDPVPAGQNAQVKINASDPDAQTVTLDATVTDSAGNSAEGTTTFQVSDPLAYEATVDAGALTQDAGDPSKFIWAA